MTYHPLLVLLLQKKLYMSLIRSLNPNKAHGWDEISVKMVKICDDAIAPALKIIFDSALASGTYPTSWKKANVVPVHKKEEKNILKKTIDRYLFCQFLERFLKNVFMIVFLPILKTTICSCLVKLVFARGDSCISQLVSITHEIFRCFDANPSFS